VGDYEPVVKALASGADPAMLCQTCPWDRMCVSPPTMTRGDIDAKMAEAQAIDAKKLRESSAAAFGIPRSDAEGMPIATLVTAMTFGNRDLMAMVCPVFALRLRSSGGRGIADNLKTAMQAWDDTK
jgi:hypothetical protein